MPSIQLGDEEFICLKIPPGHHILYYEQLKGIGKYKRNGQYQFNTENIREIFLEVVFSGVKITVDL